MSSCFDLYMNMYERRKKGESFASEKEIDKAFPGLKSGKFAERCVSEVFGNQIKTNGKCRIIERKSSTKRTSTYQADGFIPSLNAYVEVKNYLFGSSGTAGEKLPNFLLKAEEYDKKVLIIFCGEHELLNDDPSYKIWTAFHTPEICTSPGMLALVNAVREKIFDIVKLSELRDWAKQHQHVGYN